MRLKLILSLLALILLSCDAMTSFEPPIIASITVTTPSHNGDSWNDYSDKVIQWTSTGDIANVKIDIYRSSSYNGTYSLYNTIDSSESNDGSYTWNIPSNYVSSGYYYKIRIQDYYDASVYADSYYFTVY